MMLVSLADAKRHLRVDDADNNADIEMKVHAASGAVLNYIGTDQTFLDSSGSVLEDSSGDPIDVPYEVAAAVLLLLSELFDNRTNIQSGFQDDGYLPRPVKNLLFPYRRFGYV